MVIQIEPPRGAKAQWDEHWIHNRVLNKLASDAAPFAGEARKVEVASHPAARSKKR
jgi:hypothetical protein